MGQAMLVVRSFLFALGMWGSTLLVGILSVLTFPLPLKTRYAIISQWARFNLWWLRVTCRLSYEVDGQENIPDQASVILCKHQSTWETLALQEVFPPQVWLLKRELLWVPFFGWGLAMLKPIAIDRSAGRKAVAQLIAQGRQRLEDEDMWVVIYPEGTRIAAGKKGRYAAGGSILAEHTGHQVVPVAHNAGEYWPKRGFIKKPGVIRLSIGPAIETQGRKAAEINRDVEAWIEGRMREITTMPECYQPDT